MFKSPGVPVPRSWVAGGPCRVCLGWGSVIVVYSVGLWGCVRAFVVLWYVRFCGPGCGRVMGVEWIRMKVITVDVKDEEDPGEQLATLSHLVPPVPRQATRHSSHGIPRTEPSKQPSLMRAPPALGQSFVTCPRPRRNRRHGGERPWHWALRASQTAAGKSDSGRRQGASRAGQQTRGLDVRARALCRPWRAWRMRTGVASTCRMPGLVPIAARSRPSVLCDFPFSPLNAGCRPRRHCERAWMS